jgi:hypothetical protein
VFEIFGLLEVCADIYHGLEGGVTGQRWKHLSCHYYDAAGKFKRPCLIGFAACWYELG